MEYLVTKRFWSKVEIGNVHECWEWRAGKYCSGYGAFSLNGRMKRAHRIAYELVRGPILSGLVIDHKCRNISCVNPFHLETVTQRINIQRANRKIKTHCLRGHARTSENLTSNYNCKLCRYEAYHRRNKGTKND